MTKEGFDALVQAEVSALVREGERAADPIGVELEKLLATIRDTQEIMRRATKRIERYDEVFDMLITMFDGEVDVNDGDYGIPEPNRAMQVINAIDYARGLRPAP